MYRRSEMKKGRGRGTGARTATRVEGLSKKMIGKRTNENAGTEEGMRQGPRILRLEV